MVNSKLPVRNLRDLIALARERPGRLTYATPGIGTESHLIGEMFKLSAGVNIAHVPYRGGGAAITDLIAGTVDMMPVVTSTIMQHLNSGAVRALATTSRTRLTALPDVPTAAEEGFRELVATPSWGLFAPAHVPPFVLETWRRSVRQIERDETYRRAVAELGGIVTSQDEIDFPAALFQENAQWRRVIERGQLRAE